MTKCGRKEDIGWDEAFRIVWVSLKRSTVERGRVPNLRKLSRTQHQIQRAEGTISAYNWQPKGTNRQSNWEATTNSEEKGKRRGKIHKKFDESSKRKDVRDSNTRGQANAEAGGKRNGLRGL